MLIRAIDSLNNRASDALKWFLMVLSGLLTSGLIVMLEM